MFRIVKFGIQSCVKFNDWNPKSKAQLVAYKRSKEVVSSFGTSSFSDVPTLKFNPEL